MHLSAAAYCLALAVMFIGAVIQGSVGFGLNLLGAPLVAMLEPKALPGSFVVIGIPVAVLTAYRERHAIDWHGVAVVSLGRLPGTVLGSLVVLLASGNAILIAVGIAVMASSLIAALAPPIELTRRNKFLAGVGAGTTGTAAGLDGPPLALLYQRSEGPTIRSTLAICFLVGSGLSLLALAAMQRIHLWQMALAAALYPAVLAGQLLAVPLRVHLHGQWLRRVVLGVAAAAGAAAALRGVLA